MFNQSFVSVYITTKNRQVLLKRAIESVLAQTWGNMEIIVCDDASSDGTIKLLEEFANKYENFRWLQNEKSLGACVSRNKAISLAKGEFITGLDDDDYFIPNRLALLMATYKDEYAFVCSTFFRKTDKETRVVKDGIGKLSLSDLLHYNKIGNQVLTRTDRLRQLGGFDESLPAFQDYDMWIRLLKEFGCSYKINDPLYVTDISHTNDRISANSDSVKNGYLMFMKKHKSLMSPRHLNSMQLLSQVVNNQPLSLWSLIKLCNSGNYKSILNSLFKRN